MLLSSVLQSHENRNQGHKLALVAHTCNPSIQEAEVGGSP